MPSDWPDEGARVQGIQSVDRAASILELLARLEIGRAHV